MRYIAKIHVLDVMDKVVVSGYVYDADDLTDPDHTVTDFTYECLSYGHNRPLDWLVGALYSALVDMNKAAQGRP
jgi:hypothetical protein